MKTENRTNHKWGKEDEWGIYECQICHSLMKKRAFGVHITTRTSGERWEHLYSLKGTKWTSIHSPCK